MPAAPGGEPPSPSGRPDRSRARVPDTGLITPRLRLRRLRPSDEPRLLRLETDPEVMRYIGSRGGAPEAVARRVRERIAADHGAYGWWVIEGRSDGTFHGIALLLSVPGGSDVELGYRLARPSWGRGFATEAAGAVLEHAFGALGLARVIAVTAPENLASRAVLARLGFADEGPDRYQGVAVCRYGFSAGDWRARR